MRLLLVEDNARLSHLIVAGLAKEGFAVDAVATVSDTLSALSTTHFALVILDLGLPDGDGLAVIQHLRSSGSTTPLLVLTARQSTEDKVKGLQQGADDYLGKPFAFDELVARIRALLRRPSAYLGGQLKLGDLAFDTAGKEITVQGVKHQISAREAIILEALLRRSNHVVPKTILEDQLYGLSSEGSTNAVEVYVHRLRKQLEQSGAQVAIHTIRGIGYLIREVP
ncbi:MAG TPA: response regulator transcription factor [Rhizomicrobium sp.]|nr:response regulator transcription factor [Rhizomicrobium sp.]